MHKRRKILEELAVQLRTLPQFSAVYIQRNPSTRIAYPYLTIHAENEEVETLLVHPQPRAHDRSLTIMVSAYIKGTVDDEKAEQDMDDAALAIEEVMDLPTDSEADTILFTGTEFNIDDIDPLIHTVKLTYRLTYTAPEFGAEY